MCRCTLLSVLQLLNVWLCKWNRLYTRRVSAVAQSRQYYYTSQRGLSDLIMHSDDKCDAFGSRNHLQVKKKSCL